MRFVGVLYVVSTVALFSWLLGQPTHPPRVWVNDWFGMTVEAVSMFCAGLCAANAIWPAKDDDKK